jgi:hypothetical protein
MVAKAIRQPKALIRLQKRRELRDEGLCFSKQA